MRFDPKGDPTQTTPAEVKLSVDDLAGEFREFRRELVEERAQLETRLGLGSNTMQRLAEERIEDRRRITKIESALKENTELTEQNTLMTAESYALSQLIYSVARPIGKFFNAVGVVAYPFVWTIKHIARLSYRLKWLIAIGTSLATAYAQLTGKLFK